MTTSTRALDSAAPQTSMVQTRGFLQALPLSGRGRGPMMNSPGGWSTPPQWQHNSSSRASLLDDRLLLQEQGVLGCNLRRAAALGMTRQGPVVQPPKHHPHHHHQLQPHRQCRPHDHPHHHHPRLRRSNSHHREVQALHSRQASC